MNTEFFVKFKRERKPTADKGTNAESDIAASRSREMQFTTNGDGLRAHQSEAATAGTPWGKRWKNPANWLSRWRKKSATPSEQTVFEALAELRRLYHTVLKETQQSHVYIQLNAMYRAADFLTRLTAAANQQAFTQLSAALTTLLYNLYTTPKTTQHIPLRTVAQALDTLDKLALAAETPVRLEDSVPPCILVVDDDATCAQVIATAVERTGLKAINLDSPLVALEVVKTNRFQLVYLDISMPNMMGFEVCSRLRMLPGYEQVPIVFVTSHADFSTRTHASLSGGTDFVLKPFLLTELVVKTLCHINHFRITNQILEAGYPNAKAPMATGQPLF